MKITEVVADLGKHLTTDKKLAIVEAALLAPGQTLLESNSPSYVEYFNDLSHYSVTPKNESKYIVTLLMLFNNTLRTIKPPEWVTVVSFENGKYVVKDNNGQIDYFPKESYKAITITRSFFFDRISNFEKFKVAASIKFADLDLNFDTELGNK